MTKERSSRRGAFTLVEILVVIGITTLLSVVAITYSKIGQNEVALTVETSKIAEVILQAKELAINTYGTSATGARACAFGVHFDFVDQTYTLFAFSPGLARCPSAASTTQMKFTADIAPAYESNTDNIPLSPGVRIEGGPNDFADILFYPPDPTTLINVTPDFGGGYFVPAPAVSTVHLSTMDGQNHSTISINAKGQVTF